MNLTSKLAILLGILICIGLSSARADELQYTLTVQGSSTPYAVWDMPSTPNTLNTSTCGSVAPLLDMSPDANGCAFNDTTDNIAFFAFDAQLCFNGSTPKGAMCSDGSTPTLDSLLFINTSGQTPPYAVLEDVNGSGIFPWLANDTSPDQLYSGSGCSIEEQCPEMKTGTFSLDADLGVGPAGDYTLSVSEAPGSGSGSNGVPEPSSLGMLAIGLMSLLCLTLRRLIAGWVMGRLPAAP